MEIKLRKSCIGNLVSLLPVQDQSISNVKKVSNLKMPRWFCVSFFSLMFLYFRREAVWEYYNGDHDQDKADPGTEVDVL